MAWKAVGHGSFACCLLSMAHWDYFCVYDIGYGCEESVCEEVWGVVVEGVCKISTFPIMPANKKYKDTVFTSLFNDKKLLLELYNALEGTSYANPNLIEINTLSGVLFKNRRNDLSFIIDGKIVVLVEHQSSINENMPLRMLQYYAKSYDKVTTKKDIYRRRLIKIPRPEFIVFYNGKEKFPEQKTLRLSDAYIQTNSKGKKLSGLELEVRVVNINKGHNVSILRKSKALSGYSEFIAKIREFEGKGCEIEDAIKKAISYCVDKGVLRDYLRKHSALEVVNMLLETEFKIEEAVAVAKEEGMEEGILRTAKKMLKKGLDPAFVADITGFPLKQIKTLR
jgi:predicted transposase/invertase (TIGR01784 family)